MTACAPDASEPRSGRSSPLHSAFDRSRDRAAVERVRRTGATLAVLALMYVDHRLRRHARLPPAAHAPLVPDATSRSSTLFAILGSMAVQGPVIVVGRRPPQAPRAHRPGGRPALARTGHGGGFKGAITGLWYAHMGWLFDAPARPSTSATRATSYEDRGMRFINRHVPRLWCSLGLLIPAALGFAARPARWRGAAHRRCSGAASCASSCCHHVTWSINSVCHFFGTPPLRRRGPLDQRLLARAALVRRVLAPQPPRVPALGRARPASGGRSTRPACVIRGDAAASGSPGTWSRSRPSARRRRPRRSSASRSPPSFSPRSDGDEFPTCTRPRRS